MENPLRYGFFRYVGNRKDSNDFACFGSCQKIHLELDKTSVPFLRKTDVAAHGLFHFLLGICLQQRFIHIHFHECCPALFIRYHPGKPLEKCLPVRPEPFHQSGICGVPHFHHLIPWNIAVTENQFIGTCFMIMLQKLLLIPALQLFLFLNCLGNICIHYINPADTSIWRQHGQRTAGPEITPIFPLHTGNQFTRSFSVL